MGMHFGVLVIEGSQDVLARGLAGVNTRLVDFRPGTTIDEMFDSGEHEDPTAVQTADELTLLFDGHMLITHDPDLVVELSRLSGKRACGCVGETVSGTYDFFYADAGRIVRAYSHCHAGQSEAWEVGRPLITEQRCPFNEALDGSPFFDAIKEIGLGDVRPLIDNAKWRPCTPDIDFNASRSISNELTEQSRRFYEAHALAEPPPIQVVVRRPEQPRTGWGQRLRRLFGLG